MTRYKRAFCFRSANQLEIPLLTNCWEQERFDAERDRLEEEFDNENQRLDEEYDNEREQLEEGFDNQRERFEEYYENVRESLEEGLEEDLEELRVDECYQEVLKDAGKFLADCTYSLLMGGISQNQIYEDCNTEYDMFVASRSETRGCPQ